MIYINITAYFKKKDIEAYIIFKGQYNYKCDKWQKNNIKSDFPFVLLILNIFSNNNSPLYYYFILFT